MTHLAIKLAHHFPGAQWSLSGDDYAGLEWLDESPKPTEAEVEALPDPPPPPRVILAGWFKAALARLGHAPMVGAAVASQPLWKQELWKAATHVREDDADVVAIAGALNINLAAVFDEAERIRIETRG
jgi:hypothetical protein